MDKIFARIFGFLKYLLLVGAFVLTFMGLVLTYKRLEKSLTEAIHVFLPFILVFILFIANLFIKRNGTKDNLFFNFVSCLVLGITIMIGLRAKFDTNMIQYFKYKIDYNPQYFSDNLSAIELMLYCLAGSNVLFIVSGFLEKKKVIEVVSTESVKSTEAPVVQLEEVSLPIDNSAINNVELKTEIVPELEEQKIEENPLVETIMEKYDIGNEIANTQEEQQQAAPVTPAPVAQSNMFQNLRQ